MLKDDIFNISNTCDFKATALQVFQYQYQHNSIYNRFCKLLKRSPKNVNKLIEIPFLPIQFFKTESILSTDNTIQNTFISSGTTGGQTSTHFVADISIYQTSFKTTFKQFYGHISDYVVLALLPSYLESKGSSLIYMVNQLIKDSKHQSSGFYLNNFSELAQVLRQLDNAGKKVLLIGVSFALLDLIEQFTFKLKHTIIMETGGMKGRRKELIREELHSKLKQGFGVDTIHSEYGMTELLSQAYSKGNGVFECPPFMKLLIRDTEDALSYVSANKTGGINVIDLANINSCSFIATQDLGKQLQQNQFEILGRFDNSDIRGCNLLAL